MINPISRRFGLQQRRKIRLIDDYTESGVNTCVTSVESPVLHTIDVACAVLALWFGLCGEQGLNPELVSRTFDLTSAYRQVALSSDGKRFACIRVFNPAFWGGKECTRLPPLGEGYLVDWCSWLRAALDVLFR